MKQVLIKKGQVIVEEVPEPIVSENEILVQVHCSCISADTEISGAKSSGPHYCMQSDKYCNWYKGLSQRGVNNDGF